MDLHENMVLHLIYTHGRTLAAMAGRSYDDLKAEHDGLVCPPPDAEEAERAELRRHLADEHGEEMAMLIWRSTRELRELHTSLQAAARDRQRRGYAR
jgi:hypothetical protein